MSEDKRVNKVYTKEEIMEAVEESIAAVRVNLLSHNKEKIVDTLIKKLNLDIKEEEYPESTVWDPDDLVVRSLDAKLLLDLSLLKSYPADKSRLSALKYGPEFVRRWNAVSRALNLITRDAGAQRDRLVVTLFGILKGEDLNG